MWVLLKINVDILWSAITKCIKVPLMSTHFACKNVFTKQLTELLLMLSGGIEQNPGSEKEKSWELIKSGLPQGSVLGPLFFLIYINGLPDNLESNCKIFADDTSLFLQGF